MHAEGVVSGDDDELKQGVREELRRYSDECFATVIQRLTQKVEKVC
jgi:hypothetical protein